MMSKATQKKKLLCLYLQDHLAASVGGIQLAERCLHDNPKGELGIFLKSFLKDLRVEQNRVRSLLKTLGGSSSFWKEAGAWVFEKIGRLNLSGNLFLYSGLSRLLELEALLAGVRAKLDMWWVLNDYFRGKKLTGFNTHLMIDRTKRQLEMLQMFCLAAAQLAFKDETKQKVPA